MKIGNLKCYGIIYKIINKVNNKVYIGQTTKKNGFKDRYPNKGNGIERVYKYHKKNKNRGDGYNVHLLRAIEKYGFDNFEVIEFFDVAFSKDELNIKEICYISIYDSFENGYNNTLGGEGSLGTHTLSGKESKVSKSVVQLNTEGEYIKTWDCISDVSNELHIDSSKICCVCRGQRKTTQGFVWVYKEDYDINKDYSCKTRGKDRKKGTKPVVQLDLDLNYVNTYKSINEAKRKTGVYTGTISSCCMNKVKSAGGYIWIYKESFDNQYDITQHIDSNEYIKNRGTTT